MGGSVFIVNPSSARSDPDLIRWEARRWLPESLIDIRVLSPDESSLDVAARVLDEGTELVVAVGGDGTVSGVASALEGTGVPLAIVPMGTANMMAEQLEIPRSPAKAVELALNGHKVRAIDGMRIGDRLYLLNAGAGISGETVRDMADRHKRKFGIATYFGVGIGRIFAFRPTVFQVTIDGVVHRFRGVEASVINAGFRKEPGLPGVPEIRPDDGFVDVFLVWAPTPGEYLMHLLRAAVGIHRVRPGVQWFRAAGEVHIETARPLLLQADGDVIGETPARVRVVREAIHMVVPDGRPTTLEEETGGR